MSILKSKNNTLSFGILFEEGHSSDCTADPEERFDRVILSHNYAHLMFMTKYTIQHVMTSIAYSKDDVTQKAYDR